MRNEKQNTTAPNHSDVTNLPRNVLTGWELPDDNAQTVLEVRHLILGLFKVALLAATVLLVLGLLSVAKLPV
jgi:hypothetical protein